MQGYVCVILLTLMTLDHVIIILSALQLITTLNYVRLTIAGRNKPNRVSFALFALAPFIGVAAATVDQGWSMSLLPVLMSGLSPLMIFLASYVNKDSYWKLGRFDWACGASALLALVLWYVTKDPLVAVVFAVIADLLAALPTVVKTWSHPETESPGVYAVAGLSSAVALLALDTWNPTEYLFPLYLVAITTIITLEIVIPRNTSALTDANEQ